VFGQSITSRRAFWFGSAWLIGLACGIGGCAPRATLRKGKIAEMEGNYYKAYVFYCDAARDRPSSRAVHAALAHVTPLASRQWLNVGRGFEQRGDIGLAWRAYMRSLLIWPPGATALAAIRRIERDHADEIADSRTAWQRYGERSLQVGPLDLEAQSWARGHSSDEAEPTGADPDAEPADKPNPPATSPPPDARKQTRALAPLPPSEDVAGASPAQKTASPPVPSAFLTVAIASRDNRRFPKTVSLGDDIRVRVLDTHKDPKVDLAIYLGQRQIEKVQNVRERESILVIGRSGLEYRVEVIHIDDRTESVEVGLLRAAPPAPVP